MAGSWAGLGAQGTWGCCWGRGPIIARGGAQGRGSRRGARRVAGRHSWGLRVLVAVDGLGAVFGGRLQVGERRVRIQWASRSAKPPAHLPTDLGDHILVA